MQLVFMNGMRKLSEGVNQNPRQRGSLGVSGTPKGCGVDSPHGESVWAVPTAQGFSAPEQHHLHAKEAVGQPSSARRRGLRKLQVHGTTHPGPTDAGGSTS